MKTYRCFVVALALSFVAIALPWASACGELSMPPHLITDHGGVGVPYVNGQWDLKAVDGQTEPPVDVPAHEALFYLNENTATAADAFAPEFHAWLGTSSGQTVYVVPQTLKPATPFFGFNLRGMTDGDKEALAPWTPADSRLEALHHHDESGGEGGEEPEAWIEIDLVSVAGLGGAAPGAFSLWTFDEDAGLTVWMSTAEPPAEGNRFFLDVAHGHSHVNWGFTAPGVYELTFQATTYLAAAPDVPVTSPATTFHFGVLAVPEPSALALVAIGAAAAAAIGAVKRRSRPC
ncbi:MAG: TIGR03769 domain-containing protein [Pirellulales bacterium]|nr:TIGR03769 domain-containing protein [Pirellulales bacterium]